MADDMGTANGNGKRKVFDVRDPQHWNFLLNGGTFLMIVAAIFWFADLKYQVKSHIEKIDRRWNMTWTFPEMVSWANADTKATKVEHADPYETAERFKSMKENN